MSSEWSRGWGPLSSNQWANHGTPSEISNDKSSNREGHSHNTVNMPKAQAETTPELDSEAAKYAKAEAIYKKKKAAGTLTGKEEFDFFQLEHEQVLRMAKKGARQLVDTFRSSGILSPKQKQFESQEVVEWDPIRGEYRTTSQNRHRRENTPNSMPPRSENSYAPSSNNQAASFSPRPTEPIVTGNDWSEPGAGKSSLINALLSYDNLAVNGKYRISTA